MADQAHVATTPRQSNIVFVVARLDLGGREYFLFHKHPKWGDWGLVGGHVEADETHDWARAAVRETEEEMEPLRVGHDLELHPIVNGPEQWGPEPSKSAGGAPTVYSGKWFSLQFLRDPATCLAKLQSSEFLLVERSRVEAKRDSDVTSLVTRLADALPNGLDDVPLGGVSNACPDVPRRDRVEPRPLLIG